ncbi:CD151 antigen-like [Spea bombifrons]|uniref:CD151 antigen-like n=1 Tax=Spea bombifrons TaxID=233779 RepID=UPI00234BCFD5|nr:CD151 antigen-like [Spea bombifrons]
MQKVGPPDRLLCVKAVLFCVILIFWVTGVVLISVGAYVQLRLSDVSVILTETSSGAPLVLTIVGMVIFFLSGFGALAALRESSSLVKSFSVVMLVIFVVEVIVGISAYSYRDRLQSNVSQRFLKVLGKYRLDPEITNAVDNVQQEFLCCGANNFTDWLNSTSTLSATSVPQSCCRRVQPRCGENPLENTEKIYQEGCVVKMKSWISEHIGVIGAVALGLGISQIFGILLSWLFVRILQENYVSM